MGAQFSDYITDRLLPARGSDVRRRLHDGPTLALISHAPSPGVHYPPVDDFIVSIVRKSGHARVVRDIGLARQAFTESRGCICVTPPGTWSYWEFDSSPQILHFAIPVSSHSESGVLMKDLSEETFAGFVRPHYDPVVEALADRVWETASETNPLSELVCEQGALTIASLVLERFLGAPRARHVALPTWRLNRAIELLAADLAEPPSIKDLAKAVGLSSSHFSRAFSASTGCSPHDWLSRRRVERAKVLLENSSRSITDIAFELGYASPNHFASRFRQFTGTSPRDWRRKRSP